MTKRITKNFQTHSAKQFIESIDEAANNIYYMVVGKHTEFSDDTTPPAVNNNVQATFYDPNDNFIFGKQITSSDVKHMATRYDWTSGTVYAMYDDTNSNLYANNFYVVSPESGSYHVFKCLYNSDGAPSTAQPLLSETSADDEIYIKTTDGYQWKYMYSISSAEFTKFATANNIPVIPNANVSGNAVSGAIDVILVTTAGSDYNAYANGTISVAAVGGNTRIFEITSSGTLASNNDFYKDSSIYIGTGTGAGQLRKITDYVASSKRLVIDTAFTTLPDTTSTFEISPYVEITGDGQNATARALVNSTANTIANVQIVTRGSGYTFATATVTGNTGTINVSSNSAISANSAVARVIISPQHGHGNNVINELGADKVGISVTFANNETGTIPTDNDYRQISVVKDPLFREVVLSIDTLSGTFQDEEVVTASTSGANGIISGANSTVVTISNTAGFFVTGETITGATSNATANVAGITSQVTTTFDQRYKYTITLTDSGTNGLGFIEDEEVKQNEGLATEANAFVHAANSTVVFLTNQKGNFELSDSALGTVRTITGQTSAAVGKLETYTAPDLVKGCGELIYLENLQPISRANNQSETVKLIIEF